MIEILFVLLVACTGQSPAPSPKMNNNNSTSTTPANKTPAGFVTRAGTQLMLDGRPFRFAGANMHWLGLEDSTDHPTQFRVDDGFAAAKEMGATVVRAHNLGISTGCRNCIEPELGVFNEDAFRYDDYAIKVARDYGIRLVIPLTDNWHYPAGGKHNFTDWRGISDENQFYYNKKVIGDFKEYIRRFLTHVNTYTGVAYKDDPTILAWETGNELQPPTEWTQTISTYIKSIDPHHLVIDGKNGIDPNAASLTNVDIVSAHYYPKNVPQLRKDAEAAKKAGKVFYVGEFDWNDANGGASLTSFLSTIENDTEIAGDSFWELMPHNDQYGYVVNDKEYSLHYPGDTKAMRAAVQQLRLHAYKMRGDAVPPDSIPGSPVVTAVSKKESYTLVEWRGTAVAATYSIERSTTGPQGPWTLVCKQCITDALAPWRDPDELSGTVWYRVIAYNLSGVAGKPSEPYRAEL
ncbi:MAG: cellulase family glycosylhydrolase [Ktedonobacteraceae bacterium]|nr:cellulase family glycosylhydrolase [Ktedonobacteraceae bacterium]